MISLPLVIETLQDLKIRLDVQSADDRATQRHDVIDLVPNSGLLRESARLCVDSLDRCFIRPSRRGVAFSSGALSNQRIDLLWIFLGPPTVVLTAALGIGFAPAALVFVSVLLIALVPIYECLRVLSIPFLAVNVYARCASNSVTVRRGSVDVETIQSSDDSAASAFFQPQRLQPRFCGAAISQRRVTLIGSTRFAHVRNAERSAVWALSGGPHCAEIWQRLLSQASRARLTRRRHLIAPMWASMMRRTNSAMEMPRRFASRVKNLRCGSVKEIICLVNAVLHSHSTERAVGDRVVGVSVIDERNSPESVIGSVVLADRRPQFDAWLYIEAFDSFTPSIALVRAEVDRPVFNHICEWCGVVLEHESTDVQGCGQLFAQLFFSFVEFIVAQSSQRRVLAEGFQKLCCHGSHKDTTGYPLEVLCQTS